MDKIRLYQIINTLLLPYREEGFGEKNGDVLADMRYNFSALQERYNKTKMQRKKQEKAYYESEKKLRDFLVKRMGEYTYTLDDFKMLLDLFFPESECYELYRKNYGKNEAYQKDNSLDRVYLHNLYKIAESLLTFRDGDIAVRMWNNEGEQQDIFCYSDVFDKVEIWNLLGRMISTDVIVVAFFVLVGLEEVFYLDKQTGGILLADKVLNKILQKGLAETHMHFNAGVEFSYLWQRKTDFRIWGKEKDLEGFFPYILYRMLWAEYLETSMEVKFEVFLRREYEAEFCDLNNMLNLLCDKEKYFSISDKVGEKLYMDLSRKWHNKYPNFDDQSEEFLFSTVYKKYKVYRTYSEIILLFRTLWYFKKYDGANETEELHLFLQYLRMKNQYFSQVVQANQIQGLSNFSKFYGKMSKELWLQYDSENRSRIVFKSIANNSNLKKIELRATPRVRIQSDNVYYKYESAKRERKIEILECILPIFRAFREHILNSVEIAEESVKNCENEVQIIEALKRVNISMPTIGIIFHFRKEDSIDNKIADFCWLSEVSDIKTESRHLVKWRRAMVETAKSIEELRSEIPKLSEYIVGIDAASEENRAEPWIFAPVYAAIRNRTITKPKMLSTDGRLLQIHNIGFTYHVGEEFRHILSGLRHIDEVIQHFHYKAGDRLGHALALGIDMKEWMEKNKTVIIPIQEHMENLLWVWGKLVHDGWEIKVNTEILVGEIMELAKKIYGEINGLSVHMLYDAYIKKFKLRYEKNFIKMKEHMVEFQKSVAHEHFCKFYNLNSPYGIFWSTEKIFCTYFCPIFYQKFKTPIFVQVNEKQYDMLSGIQECLIDQVEKIGIYVEANPTSNLSIGDIKELYSEPILKLNSKELEKEQEHEVLITINSDDPIIFNTSSENELAYVYHALTYHGYKKESVLQWIDKVRQMGMESSFIKEEKSIYQQYCELTELIKEIEKYTFTDTR